MNILQWLNRATRAAPNSAALYLGTTRVATYAELADATSRRAASLNKHWNLQPGDRAVILSPNCTEYLEAMYAVWWAGGAVVPVNAKLHAREAEFILAHSGATVCFVSAEWKAALAAVALPAGCRVIELGGDEWHQLAQHDVTPMAEPMPREPNDLAWLFYTSGTTGRPKGAMLTHRNLMAMTFNYFTDVDEIAPDDCIVHAAPISHGSGLYNFAHLLRGAAQVVPASGGFDAAEVLDLCRHFSGVTMFAAPTIVKRLTEVTAASDARVPGLKTIVYGGGPMYVSDLKRAMEVFGDKFVQIYGQGESPMTITALPRSHHGDAGHPRYEQRLASVGRAHSGVEVRVCDEESRALPAGEVGEICVRGDTVMAGYWNDAEASARALRGGWLWTGDLGVMDEDGFLTLKDRSKDVIISGGS
ncbi:MAG: AMP-binding protein, partial [Betaproteobacteria bacterium]|nr:AMP-binding protein [Betaproteobacteria bacterium]